MPELKIHKEREKNRLKRLQMKKPDKRLCCACVEEPPRTSYYQRRALKCLGSESC